MSGQLNTLAASPPGKQALMLTEYKAEWALDNTKCEVMTAVLPKIQVF
jgi:hypothetical protein